MRFSKKFLSAFALVALLSACGNQNKTQVDPLACKSTDEQLRTESELLTKTEVALYQLLKSNADKDKKIEAIKNLIEIEKAFAAKNSNECKRSDGSSRKASIKENIIKLLQEAIDDLKAGRPLSPVLLRTLYPQGEAEIAKIADAWDLLWVRLRTECGLVLKIKNQNGKKSIEPESKESIDATVKQARESKDYPVIKAAADDKTLQLPNVIKSMDEIIAGMTDELINSLGVIGQEPADGRMARDYLSELLKSLTSLDEQLRKHEGAPATTGNQTSQTDSIWPKAKKKGVVSVGKLTDAGPGTYCNFSQPETNLCICKDESQVSKCEKGDVCGACTAKSAEAK